MSLNCRYIAISLVHFTEIFYKSIIQSSGNKHSLIFIQRQVFLSSLTEIPFKFKNILYHHRISRKRYKALFWTAG